MQETNRKTGAETAIVAKNAWRQAKVYFKPILTLSLLAVASCSGPRPLKGGRAFTTHGPSGHLQQTLAQGENPAQPSAQDQEVVKVRTFTVPAGSKLEQSPSSGASWLESSNAPFVSIILAAPMPVVEREEVRANTRLGASQKDTAREMGAKLSSLRSVTWVGLGLLILGLASLVWAPLRAVIGSVTTSIALLLGGLALMVLPTLIAGNELLILGGVALTAGAWFLAHRHGQLRGQLSSYSTPPSPDSKQPNVNPTNNS